MSIIREVAVEYSRTINLGNYESERVQVSLTATVGPEEDSLAATQALFDQAVTMADEELRSLEQERQVQRGR